MKKLKLEEDTRKVEFSGDPIGRVCIINDNVYRLVSLEQVEYVKTLFDSGLIQELIEKGLLVNTWIDKEVCMDGYELIIQHEKIENWNYPYDWSFSMLKSAADVVLQANKVCNKFGYELFDVHPYNVVFKASKPLYVDIGSILKKDPKNGESWSGFDLFKTYFLTPLSLYSKGYVDLPTALFLHNSPMSSYDLFKLRNPMISQVGFLSKKIAKFSEGFRKVSIASPAKLEERYGNHPKYKWLLRAKKLGKNRYTSKKAEQTLRSISPPKFTTYWGNYHDKLDVAKTDRFRRILHIIASQLTDAKSLVEIGSNQGKFARQILNETGIQNIIATDYDKNAVDRMFLDTSSDSSLLPLVYNFLQPLGKVNLEPIEKRIKADVVMALAITHHLILTQGASLHDILKKLKTLTHKYVIVEFMPYGLYGGEQATNPPVPEYYTQDWFQEEFEIFFDTMVIENLEKNRTVFVGKIK